MNLFGENLSQYLDYIQYIYKAICILRKKEKEKKSLPRKYTERDATSTLCWYIEFLAIGSAAELWCSHGLLLTRNKDFRHKNICYVLNLFAKRKESIAEYWNVLEMHVVVSTPLAMYSLWCILLMFQWIKLFFILMCFFFPLEIVMHFLHIFYCILD